jgi:hypothetical protein
MKMIFKSNFVVPLCHQFATKQFKNGKQRFYENSFCFGFGRVFNGSGQFHNYKFFPIPL